MKPDDFPKLIRDCLAVHEAFRRLGYPPESIFVVVYTVGRVDVVLKWQGKEFTVVAGKLPSLQPATEFRRLWQLAVEHWNGVWTQEERQRIWREGPVLKHDVEFLLALKRKGFVVHPVADSVAHHNLN